MDRLRKRLHDLNTKGCLWMYILRILFDGETHAYSIRGKIAERYGFSPGTVTAYRVLYHLSSKGLVEKRVIGRRKVYRITKPGREALKDAVSFYKGRARALS